MLWKLEGLYGGNMTELLQAGGYGLDKNNDPIANKTLSVWTEFSGDFSDSLEWGVFGGYSKDYGFGEQVAVLYSEREDGQNAYRQLLLLQYLSMCVQLTDPVQIQRLLKSPASSSFQLS